ncbi:MAG TPA: radical SAM protein [Phenylobacterium sp.]
MVTLAVAEDTWHVTVLSNFARGYDKYARTYSKAAIPESTYPDRFYLLRPEELAIGVEKASRLRAKLALPGDRLLAIRTRVGTAQLSPNLRNGLGRYVEGPAVKVDGLAEVSPDGGLTPISVEDAYAGSLQLLTPQLQPFAQLQPRTLSLLPIARGCQARCAFCFSAGSASSEQAQARLDLARLQTVAEAARARGATRFVITGGGEPGLLRRDQLLQAIRIGRKALGKAVLITNGAHLASAADGGLDDLAAYAEAGLDVLSVSRHHWRDDANGRIMALHIDSERLAAAWRAGGRPVPTLRFVCVLQQGGVDSPQTLSAYLDWTVAQGVREVCFKELYVSTSLETAYHATASNAWSRSHQVPLSLVLDFAKTAKFEIVDRLPWGAPVFAGPWRGTTVRIAAYTEPSLFWERAHGMARSWNLMADGRCLVSLEDRESEISIGDAACPG